MDISKLKIEKEPIYLHFLGDSKVGKSSLIELIGTDNVNKTFVPTVFDVKTLKRSWKD